MISMREVRICIQYYDSPCGRLVLASFADRLCLCDWSDNPFAERKMLRLTRNMKTSFKTETTSVLEETKRQLDEYFAGKRKAFDIQLRLAGTDFQHEVWNALLDIPYGATKSYKDIAQCIGKPKAVRAVAGAIGANGISILIPCHRVIGSDHSLTGYAGGLEAKRGYIYKKIRLSERREKFACIKLLQYQYKNRNFALQREKQRTQTERFLIIS